MMKASKGILGLFLALFVLVSGVCVGDDSGDILDFLPAFAKWAKFGNAVAKPFFIVPGVSTPVTITAYIPEADLVADSVQLKDGTALIGNLTDTGNKVFSLTSNFQRDNGGPIKLNISATFGTVNKTIAQFEIKVLSLPTLQNASQYNQNIDNIYTSLVATKDNVMVLQDSSISAAQFSTNLSATRDRLLSVYASLYAIYCAETHSPSNYPRCLDFLGSWLKPGVQNLQDTNEAKTIFVGKVDKDPNDPRVANIRAWLQDNYAQFDIEIQTMKGREAMVDFYFLHGAGLIEYQTLQALGKMGVEGEMSQFTSLTGFGIGELFGSAWGKLTGIVGDKFIDIYITINNEMGMVAGTITNGQEVQLPAGSHDVLFSFGGVLDRAIARNIPVNPNSTTTVNIAPGETKFCKYSYQDLGAGTVSLARCININGQVVGYYTSQDGNPHAFLWSQASGLQDLWYLPGIYASTAYCINNNNDVVGNSGYAFLWNSSHGMKDLATLSGTGYSVPSTAWSINNKGQVVGDWDSPSPHGETHAFLWNSSDGMKDLGTLLGGTFSKAQSINDKGYIVGMAWDSEEKNHAFLWTPSDGMRDLNDLVVNLPNGTTVMDAYGINENNQIVGYLHNAEGKWRAFVWSTPDGLKDLGTLDNSVDYSYSMGRCINNLGQVVGWSNGRPFFWTPTEGMKDLNNLVVNLPTGVTLCDAYSINDAGQIVGNTLNNSAFLLTPIP